MTEPGPDPTLERLLEEARFTPRASLGPEIHGRWRQGEAPGPTGGARRRWPAAAAALLVIALAGLTWWPGRQIRTVDRCCQDLDGGGEADDGLLLEVRGGSAVRRLAIYEDRDGSRSYTPGDRMRFDRGSTPSVVLPVAEGLTTTEFCCLDYDGGGPADDALIVLGRPPDRIAMAAIYEHRGARSGTLHLR